MVSYFKGMMGQPAWGFPEDLQKVVLKGEEPITCRPGELLAPVDFDKACERRCRSSARRPDMNAGLLSYCLYPKVVRGILPATAKEYGYIMRMGSHVFFNGMALGETNKINIEDGKTLVIKYLGLGDLNERRHPQRPVRAQRHAPRGRRTRSQRRRASVKQVTLADPEDKSQVGASIPGMVSKINVKPGDTVEENQVLAVIEAMKMETSVTARMAGKVKSILVSEGSTVKAGELLITVE